MANTIGSLLETVAGDLGDMRRKVEDTDVSPLWRTAAEHWLAEYTGTFDFLRDLRTKMLRDERHLSTGQARGVLNCWRAELQRNGNVRRHAPAAATRPEPVRAATRPEVVTEPEAAAEPVRQRNVHRKTYTEQQAAPHVAGKIPWATATEPMPADVAAEDDLLGPKWCAWQDARIARSDAAYRAYKRTQEGS